MVDGEKRSASAIAKSACKVSVIFKPDLDEFIEKYPRKGIKILTWNFEHHCFTIKKIK
ncbi:MAG: cyclic nucleotide-binding domain-containing protein [Ignavibacteriales bacterium]|nr:cyclic nucleotide-binding domain-containing protein [Ignavibacteriales bacterium]